ncbi:MAG: CPBP family glutamic-type intramembrane protease, partial [Lacipirellulaceae bacterium]
LLNGALQQVFDSETVHPFIDQIVRGKEYSLFAAAAFAAVVQAPVFEETVFRLVLQGWLEKQEALILSATSQTDHASAESIEPLEHENENTPERSPRLVPWLPRGSISIVISALLFGFAHIGQGVAPVALVLLGFVLGYLYQRTHRIVSCMVLHALFNGFTMLIIWLSME